MIITEYTEDDKNEVIANVPFHIERPEDLTIGEDLSTFYFKDELLEENPLDPFIDIILKKTPLYCSNNNDLGILRDPGKKDVPSMFHEEAFWQTFFKHTLGPLYNEMILYSHNRLKYPYTNEVPLLYDGIFKDNENIPKEITFEETSENEELTALKLTSLANFIGYNNPQVELMDYWLSHLIASARIFESEKERETLLYKAQDMGHELIRRKVAGSSAGYKILLNSINTPGSLFPTVPLPAEGGIRDPRLTRAINLPGITTEVADLNISPSSVFDEIPLETLVPSYYSSASYSQSSFEASPSSFLRYKSRQLVWDNLRGIPDSSVVKVTYNRLDRNPLETLDDDPIVTLDQQVSIFDLSISDESFLDIQANRIFNIQNSLLAKKGKSYPYYLDTVAESTGPVLSDVPWLSYIENSIDEKKRVSEKVGIGPQLSILDNTLENFVTVRELGFAYKANIDDLTEDYVYDSNTHNYMFIYDVEIQYHKELYVVCPNYPVKTLMTIVYLRQPQASIDLSEYDSYGKFIRYSTGLLPFKFPEVKPLFIKDLVLNIDETDLEEPVKDYIEDSGYAKAYFYFTEDPHKNLQNTNTTLSALEIESLEAGFSTYPSTSNEFYFIYGYRHETGKNYWSQPLNISRLDELMALTEMSPDWREKILHLNPHGNFSPQNCFTEITASTNLDLQSLSLTHQYDVYNNDADEDSTTIVVTDGNPLGFYLKRTRDVSPDYLDLNNEIFQIWGDNRWPADGFDGLDPNASPRNDALLDDYGIYHLLFDKGAGYTAGATLDTYMDIVPSTTMDSSHWPVWYWNRENARLGMSFFIKASFKTSTETQTLLNRAVGSGATYSIADEFKIYYDTANSKFVFEVYPTGYSVDNAGSSNLGQLVFSVELPWTFEADITTRLGFTYRIADTADALVKTVNMAIIKDGEYAEQVYTITQTATSGTRSASPSTFTATYTVYDETASAYLQVNSSNDIVLDDANFNYNEDYPSTSSEHFLGQLIKDDGQTNYDATLINLFHDNAGLPFIGRLYDLRLHTIGFSTKEALIFTRGSRKELFSFNIDSQKVYHHYAGDFALPKRFYDDPLNVIDGIKVFDRSKWNSIIVDPFPYSVEEADPIEDRYNPSYASPASDRDVFDGTGDDAEGVIRSSLKSNIEIIGSILLEEGSELYYKGKRVYNTNTLDMIQTSLYPVKYKNFPVYSNPVVVEDGGSLKAYRTGVTSVMPAGAESIDIETAPSGDTLKYKLDITPQFKMKMNSFPTSAFYKGSKLEHYYDNTLDEVAIRTPEGKGGVASALSNLLVMPLLFPTQTSTLSWFQALSMKGISIKNSLEKFLDPAAFYQEYVYPYQTGYRIDAVKTLKEGVYYVPIRIPLLIEADKNNTFRKIHRNLETLIKVEVVGTIVDNSDTLIPDDTALRAYYDEENLSGSSIIIDEIPADEYGESAYRKITIKAYYYKCVEGTWSWSQILSNDETEVGADAELAYDVNDITIQKDIEFYLTTRKEDSEFFDWDATTQVFEDFSAPYYPDGRLRVYSSTDFPSSLSETYLRENRSYLMYINLDAYTSAVRFSSDISCEPYESHLFEDPNKKDITNSLNLRLEDLGLISNSLNYGYSISGGVFEAIDLNTGKLGDPYAQNQTNQLLEDLDYIFADANIHFYRFKNLDSSASIDYFPVGFYQSEGAYKENITEIYRHIDGNVVTATVNETSSLQSHYFKYKYYPTDTLSVVKGFYCCKPIIDGNFPTVEDIYLDEDAQLYTYALSTDAKSVPKWVDTSKTYDQFTLFDYESDYSFFKIAQDNNPIYSDSTYHIENVYTTPGDYTIILPRQRRAPQTAYVKIETADAVEINGIEIAATTPTWISVDLVSGTLRGELNLTLTSDTATTIKIWDIKLYRLLETTSDYHRFLTRKDNTGITTLSIIDTKSKFVYFSESPIDRKWFIQFKSSFDEATESASQNRSTTAYSEKLKDFLRNNYRKKTDTILNPYVHTFTYKEIDDSISLGIKNWPRANKTDNLVYIGTMNYNAVFGSLDIGNAIDDGIILNDAPLADNNLELQGGVYITNEKLTATSNCIDVAKINRGESSVNAVTNVQLMAGSGVVCEFEFPPIIYDELTQHISFNILLNR